MFCSKTLAGWDGLFRGRLGHMLGALDLTRPIVRADKAMQAETMVHIGEEGGDFFTSKTRENFGFALVANIFIVWVHGKQFFARLSHCYEDE